jgi:transcriptional regulator with XRE-family HTH domain
MKTHTLSPAKIKAARQALGLTQEQLAERLGWQRQAFARIESGERVDPRFSTALQLAKALGKSVYELMD